MIKEYYEAICEGKDLRSNLLALKEALRDERELRAFAYLLGGDFSVLIRLLEHEDPKVRRNAALLLGRMESEDLLPVLFQAYSKEETRFVRADYLKAMAQMEYQPVLRQLEERMEELRGQEAGPEEQKHVAEEIRMLQKMVLRYRKPGTHKFTAYEQKEELVLVVNREQREVTARQITEGELTMLKGGIRVRNAEVGAILPIRTYTELLFPLDCGELPVEDPIKTGTQLGQTGGSRLRQPNDLTARMSRMHQGKAPYYFRIELKSKLEASKKGAYIRKVSDALEKASGGMWINSTTDYEAEVRLLERKDGTFAAMLKLYTIPEKRFAYRKESLAASISPVNAALTAELARPYLKEDAQILDPFCGVGTMLIERTKAVPAKTMYGLDIFGDAVEKARINTAQSGCRVNYINRDFFTFTHEYLFDEIITDMPQVTASKPKEEIHRLYMEFFDKAPEHLNEDAALILYVTEPQFVTEAVRRDPRYRIREQFTVNEKNHTMVFVIKI